MVKIEISQELKDRLDKESEEFSKKLAMTFTPEQTIWEFIKIANTRRN